MHHPAALTTVGALVLGAAAVAAFGDWWAVTVGNRMVEWVAKPTTLALLVVVALVLHPADDTVRAWFVVGLVCSLAGDVFLMLPDEQFVAGLGSFLLAHLAYVAGLVGANSSVPLTAVGLAVVVLAVGMVGRRVVASVRGGPHQGLLAPVVVYLLVISAMVVSAFGTASGLAVAGAMSFYVSDAILAWDRFVKELASARPAIMVTYHLGQAGLVLSLLQVHG